jgi:DNA helicase-2/ATP-dependent DNA helicase PcrA
MLRRSGLTREFDDVVLVEGEYQGMFFDPSREDAPFFSARRLHRVGITRARHRVAILRPQTALPLCAAEYKFPD